jgi:hypothetical protein
VASGPELTLPEPDVKQCASTPAWRELLGDPKSGKTNEMKDATIGSWLVSILFTPIATWA